MAGLNNGGGGQVGSFGGIPPGHGDPYIGAMEELSRRVTNLEGDMREVKTSLGRLESAVTRIDAMLTATLPTLATKAELVDRTAALENRLVTRMSALEVALLEKPSKTYMWVIIGILAAAILAAVAVGASLR